jgi:GntR family transcriptional regulator/MocR family aminotransferase
MLIVGDGAGGLQLAAWFRDQATDDCAIVQTLRADGFGIRALSEFHLGPPRRGLLLGIARTTVEQADDAACRVRRVLDMRR